MSNCRPVQLSSDSSLFARDSPCRSGMSKHYLLQHDSDEDNFSLGLRLCQVSDGSWWSETRIWLADFASSPARAVTTCLFVCLSRCLWFSEMNSPLRMFRCTTPVVASSRTQNPRGAKRRHLPASLDVLFEKKGLFSAFFAFFLKKRRCLPPF